MLHLRWIFARLRSLLLIHMLAYSRYSLQSFFLVSWASLWNLPTYCILSIGSFHAFSLYYHFVALVAHNTLALFILASYIPSVWSSSQFVQGVYIQ